MYRCFTLVLCLFITTSLVAQNTKLFQSSKVINKQFEELNDQFKAYQVYELDIQALDAAVKAPTPQYQFKLKLGNDFLWNLDLVPNDLRSPNYFVQTTSGTGVSQWSKEEIVTFKGRIVGNDFSDVRLTIDEDFLYGYVEEGGEMYFIEPLRYFKPGAPIDQFVVYGTKDVIEKNGTCGYTDMHKSHEEHGSNNVNSTSESSLGINCYEVEVAIASDFSMFTKYGGTGGAEAHAAGVLNNVQGNYDDEFEDEIIFVIVTQFVSDCNGCDPWTTSTNAGTLLNSFRTWGNGGNFGVTFDNASIWTNRDFDGPTIGVAWVGGICNSNEYNALQDFTSNANFLRVLTAHELGHNFNSNHDPGGSSDIMAPSVQNTTTWSAQSINSIDNYIDIKANQNNCLTSCASQAPPVANFEADQTQGCAPFQVNFTDLSQNAPAIYNWSFPGGIPSSSTDPNPTVIYNTAGVYDVILVVSNAAGSDTKVEINYIEVFDVPTANFDPTINGLSVFFNNLSSADATNFDWDFGDGGGSSLENPIHTYNQDGVYTVTLEASNICGFQIYTETITIITPPLPGFETVDTVGCAPLSVFFVDLSTSNTVDWNWSFPGGNPSTSVSQFPTISYNSPGYYDVILEVSNPAGTNIFTRTQYIHVLDTATAGFNYSIAGSTVNFTNTSTSATTYVWDYGDGNMSTDTNSVHTYAVDGTYIVTLTAEGICDTIPFTDTLNISNLPTADFSGDQTSGCIPMTVNYTDLSSGNTSSWDWTFPGGTPGTSTDQNPVVTYNTVGTYDVTLIATNNSGSNTFSLSNYISVDDVPGIGFSSNTSGTTTTFTNSSTNATSYSWDFGDGNSSTDSDPVHTYTGDGVYTVVLTATNNCGSVMTQEVVTIVTAPSAGATANVTSGCVPLTVQFTDQSSSNSTSWSWTFPGGSPGTSTDQNPIVTYNTAGTFDVLLTVTNAAGTDNLTLNNYIVVDDVPGIGFSSSTSGTTVTFTNSSTNATSYSWDFGDGNNSTDVNPIHTYVNDGVYTVILNATNSCGTVTTQEVVTISTPPTAGATSNVTSGCIPLTVQFTDQSSSNTTSWSWTFPGGTPGSSTDQNPTVTYNTVGTFDVLLTVGNAAGTNNTLTLSNYVVVDDVPGIGFSSTIIGTTATFVNSSTNATSYSWDFGDGNTSTDSDPMHTYATDGVYTVVLTATNNCGTVTTQEIVTIVTPPSAGATSSITSGCVPLTIQFTDQSSSNSTSWSWTFPGGTPGSSTDQNPTVTYNTAGTFDVFLTVTNAAGSDNITLNNYIVVDDLPSIGFGTTVNGLMVDFNNTSTNATSYSWDFGDGNTSTDLNPTHTYAMDGAYTVTLMATNSCGTVTTTDVVNIGTAPNAGATSNVTTGCAPLTVQFTDQSSNNSTSWSWTFPGGTPGSSTDQNPTVVYNTAGTYNVLLTVTNSSGSDNLTLTNYIVVDDVPTVGFSSSTTGTTVNFTNSSTNATSYSWDFGDGNSSTANNPTHIYAMDGVYTVTLMATNNCGTVTTTETVTIVTAPSAGATSNVTSGCVPLIVQFTDQSSNNSTSWSWTFPGGTPGTSTDQNPTVTYNTAGTFDVLLTVTNAAGSDNVTLSNYIVVDDVPSIGFGSTVNGLMVDFNNTSTNATSYNWDFGDGNTSTDVDPTHTYAMDGSYTVTLMATNNCGTVTTTDVVNIGTAPNAGATSNITSGCAPLTVQFMDQSSNNSTSWNWTFPGGMPGSSTDQNPTVVYNTAGTYDVQLTVMNTSGSDNVTLSNYIVVDDVPSIGFGSTVTGLMVDFNNTSTNATNYSWDFGDGNTSTDADPTHTYAMDGSYTVTLMATNNCGTVTTTDVVNIGTAPNAGATSNVTSGCAPLTVQFMDQSSNNSTSWNWTFPGGMPGSSTDQNPTVIYNTAGTYDVQLTVMNASGSDNITLSNYIVVDDVPSIGFGSTVTGLMVDFNNTSTNATSYSWDFGDGNTSTDVDPTHTYAMDGSYTVTLMATNNCGTVTTTDVVNIGTAPNAGATSNITSGCAPLTVQFMDQSSNNSTSWNWTFPGGMPGSSTDQNPTVVYNTVGSYDVQLTVTNASGSDDLTLTNYIVVDDVPSIGFGSTVNGLMVDFNNTSTNATTYNWDFGDGNTSTDANPTHTYALDGSYTVTLMATNNCGTVTMTDIVNIGTGPNAGATSNITGGCAPLTVQFMDQSSSNTTGWSWTFPGGTPGTSTDQNPTVVYNTAGTYDVMLTVTNASGSDDFTLTNYIVVDDVPTVDFSGTVSGSTVDFTNTSNNATSYSWDFGDGNTSTAASPSHTYAMDGVYTVTLMATNNCGTVTTTKTVTIVTAPVSGFTVDVDRGCAPLTVQYMDQSSDNTTDWLWTFPGGIPATSTDQNPIVVYNTPGSYLVTLEVSNAAGSNSNTQVDYITVLGLPTSAFTFATNNFTVDFMNNSTAATSYLWDFGDGNTSTDANPTHNYTMEGTYTVTLTATNECGQEVTTMEVVVVEGGVAPTAQFSGDVTSGCAPLSVTFTDFSTGNPTAWAWTFEGGDPATSTEQNPKVVFNDPGTYKVSLTATNAFGNDDLVLEDYITVLAQPIASFTYIGDDTGAYQFTNGSTNATSYFWDFGDGATSNEENPSHAYATSGIYEVVLVASNECGEVTFVETIEVIISSIEEIDFISSLELFPNPNDGQFVMILEGESKKALQITVINVLGQVISSEVISFNGYLRHDFDLTDKSSGVYLIQLRSEGEVGYRKVVVE